MTTKPASATQTHNTAATDPSDATTRQTAAAEAAAPPLGPDVRRVVTVVVAGALTTVLDATVVSIALKVMAADFDVTVATIQWAMTGYMLAMVAVIPLSGWAVDRIGGRTAWLVALGTFVAGSALCAVAWSAPTLIMFRVLQGLGGGLVAPVGMTMVAQAAGPQRMGRAMAMVGVPMMLGPVLGPVLGGTLVTALDWRWIFWINLPIGLLTLAWSRRALPVARARRAEPLDLLGLLLLSPAAAVLVYGLSETPAGAARAQVVIPVVLGMVLLLGFVAHASRTPHPLVDLAPLRNHLFAAAATIQLLMGIVLIGSMFLLPLYFQLARGESAWTTGLLLTPQGVGAALALWLTGRLVDRGHGHGVILTGVALTTLGLVAYTGVFPEASTAPSYTILVSSLLVMGLGTGCLMAPVSAAAYSVLDRSAIARATSLLNVTQRLGGAIGTAAFALALQHAQHRSEQTTAPTAATFQADAFGSTFWWPLGVSAAMVLPALLLRTSNRSTNNPGNDNRGDDNRGDDNRGDDDDAVPEPA